MQYTMSEKCLMLLCALPGEVPPLGLSQYRKLMQAVTELGVSEPDRDITPEELMGFGASPEESMEILSRLERQEELEQYLRMLEEKGISLITRISAGYPRKLRENLGDQAPLYLYCAGELSLFQRECISLVGSRKLREPGKQFSALAGAQIAGEGYTFCSGGAEGADTVGFQAAMEQGGTAILYLADSLLEETRRPVYRDLLARGRLLLASEYGFDQSFSTPRAMSRNRLIHAMGKITLIAQSDYETGGTWQGTLQNLRKGWSPCFVCGEEPEDPGISGLTARGCEPICISQLRDLHHLQPAQTSLF